jgi:hypothetical protein
MGNKYFTHMTYLKLVPMKKVLAVLLLAAAATACQNANETAKKENTTPADTVVSKSGSS